MAGILDYLSNLEFKPDARNMGLINMGAQMLANSGPSATPTNFGQVLGHGLGGFSQGFTQERQLQNQQRQMELTNLMAETRLANQNNMQPYYNFLPTAGGYSVGNARTGQITPGLVDGKPVVKATDDPLTQALIKQAEEGQKGVKMTDSEGREYYAPQSEINPAFKNIITQNSKPAFDISPNATPEDRALLEGMANKAGVKPNYTNSQDKIIQANQAMKGPSLQDIANIENQKKLEQGLNTQLLDKADPRRIKALSDADFEVSRMENLYKQLNDVGGVQNSKKGIFDNLNAAASSSDIGQSIGQKSGTEQARIRQEIQSAISTLVPIIKKASDTTGGQINSIPELEAFVRQLTNPKNDLNASLSQLKDLRRLYGAQSNDSTSQQPSDSLRLEARKRYGL